MTRPEWRQFVESFALAVGTAFVVAGVVLWLLRRWLGGGA